MDTLQIVLLGLVQGLTEFLPISSSAHLILFSYLFGYQDQGLIFDVAAHIGSLLAVIVYFRRELIAMLMGTPVTGLNYQGSSRQLIWWLGVATIPLGLIGLLSADFVAAELRKPLVIAWATIGFGLLLWWADRQGRHADPGTQVTASKALGIGFAQALALIPGTSRSGITMTAALLMGMSYQAAARFSFLLAIPAISAAGLFGLKEMFEADQALAWGDFALGVVASAIGAGLCIHWFLKLVDRLGMAPFVLYRLALGLLLLWLIYR